MSLIKKMFTNSVATGESEAYPELEPLEVARDADEVFEVCAELAQERGWHKVETDPDERSIRARAVTKLLRFVDDVWIRVEETRAGRTSVWMKSRSRQGKGDLGANARRIRRFLDDVAQRVDPEAGA